MCQAEGDVICNTQPGQRPRYGLFGTSDFGSWFCPLYTPGQAPLLFGSQFSSVNKMGTYEVR